MSLETEAAERILTLERELAEVKARYEERDIEARKMSFGLYDLQDRAVDLGMVGLAETARRLRQMPCKYTATKFEELITAAESALTAMREAREEESSRPAGDAELRLHRALVPFMSQEASF